MVINFEMTQKSILIGTAFTAALLAAGAVSAQDVTRYVMERTDQGFVRMDQATGAISICKEEGQNLVCRMAVDDRAAYEADITALSDRVAKLENNMSATPSVTLKAPKTELPSELEFETTLNYMEQFFRRFKGIVDDFNAEDEAAKPQSVEPAPDKT